MRLNGRLDLRHTSCTMLAFTYGRHVIKHGYIGTSGGRTDDDCQLLYATFPRLCHCLVCGHYRCVHVQPVQIHSIYCRAFIMI